MGIIGVGILEKVDVELVALEALLVGLEFEIMEVVVEGGIGDRAIPHHHRINHGNNK